MPVIIQSVTRALQIVEIIAKHPQGLSVREIANKVNLNVSTAHHLVNTLEAKNYVAALPDGIYALGAAVPTLYSAFLAGFQPDVRLLEVLNNLARTTRETSYINTWQNDDVVIQAIVESPQALRIGGLYVGYRGFNHARAGGKALLAYLSDEHLNRYLASHPLTPVSPNTIQTEAEFKAHLQGVVQQGYAIDQEEFAEGVCCIAAPILLTDGKAVAAVSVSAPTQRFTENEQHLISAVTQAAREAATVLNFRPILTPLLSVEAGGRSS
jgi:IclR family acetate operon transcriptional repressor